MPVILALILLVVVVALAFWLAFNVLGLVFMLLVAGLVGYLADVIVPGRLPWGWLGTILAGLIGSWLGVALIGQVGPSLAGIPLFPALIGAIILALVVEVVMRTASRRRAI